MRKIIQILLLLVVFSNDANAQKARIIEMPNGKYVGMAYSPTGQQFILTDITVTKLVVDPTPDVDPIPDSTNPFAGVNGLAVLLIEEQDLRHTLSTAQLAIYGSIDVRTYLDTNAAKGTDGLPEYRILDQNTTTTTNSQWKKALGVFRTSPFWVIISDGKKWASLPLPKDSAVMLELLKRFTPATILEQVEQPTVQRTAVQQPVRSNSNQRYYRPRLFGR